MNITDKPNLEQAIELCKIIHIALGGKYFPALTGGQLYKEGDRKDIDIVVYRHRQDTKDFEMTDIFETLEVIGFENLECYGFVSKGKWKGLNVDLFNPETKGDEKYKKARKEGQEFKREMQLKRYNEKQGGEL